MADLENGRQTASGRFQKLPSVGSGPRAVRVSSAAMSANGLIWMGPPALIKQVLWERGSRCPERLTGDFHVAQVSAQIELDLMVVGFHMPAELIKGLVMRPLLHVGYFVHRYHA